MSCKLKEIIPQPFTVDQNPKIICYYLGEMKITISELNVNKIFNSLTTQKKNFDLVQKLHYTNT